MQILSSDQIRAWDEYTILYEPITSLDLMERAAATCFRWIVEHYEGRSFSIFCAKGNNGGDGLAIARMLSSNHNVTVYILEFGHLGTEDFQANLARLHQVQAVIKFISTEENIPQIPEADVVIDALLGSGLNRRIEGLTAAVVSAINSSGNEVIAVDLPSGLSADNSSSGNQAITATHTLSFQCYKTAFLLPENQKFIGTLHILDIGLHPAFLDHAKISTVFISNRLAKLLLGTRNLFAHKGNFGHAVLIAGSYGKMGAAVLAARACLRSGVGLLTVHAPSCGTTILQTAVPEAMVDPDVEEHLNSSVSLTLTNYDGLGIGPGIGTGAATENLVDFILSNYSGSLVLDADALNILAKNPGWLNRLPALTILTPHPREFERLFGKTKNDSEKIELAKQKSREHNLVIVLKGHHTFIATPNDKYYFNSTGNAGLATGGTGDVLTGIITGLLAQGHNPENAALLAVYLHGLAGDIAAEKLSQPAMIASDVVKYLGQAFLHVLQEEVIS